MDREDSIIAKYCGNVEDRIKACRSKEVANFLKSHLCRELKMNCQDAAVNAFLKKYVDELILQYFDGEGHNKAIRD
jgi:hypothetical protein